MCEKPNHPDLETEDGHRYLPKSKWREQAFYETYKSQMTLLNEGLKLLGLANGGAAVALLTLVGTMVGKCKSLPAMDWPVACFSAGLFFSLLAFMAAYFTQMAFTKYLNEPKEVKWERRHIWGFSIATTGVLASMLCFVVGALWAASIYSAYWCA